MTEQIQSYRDFWPYYLREHRRRATRVLHYIGTTISIAFIVVLAATGNPWYLLVAVVNGYLFASQSGGLTDVTLVTWRVFFSAALVRGRFGDHVGRVGIGPGPGR